MGAELLSAWLSLDASSNATTAYTPAKMVTTKSKISLYMSLSSVDSHLELDTEKRFKFADSMLTVLKCLIQEKSFSAMHQSSPRQSWPQGVDTLPEFDLMDEACSVSN